MTERQKILVCGDVLGNFKSLFSRVESLNKKSGPFDFLLVTGKFFGENNEEYEAYKKGSSKVVVPTYVLGPCKESEVSYYPEDEGDEILPNVTYFGKRGMYTTSSGLKIAYMSGKETNEDKSQDYTFNAADCSSVRDACHRGQTEYRGIDILITSAWPEGVQKFDERNIDIGGPVISKNVSWLAMHIKPRYHFVASPYVYYERPPYRNVNKQQNVRELATRFIGIAPVDNTKKDKWLYACSLQSLHKIRMMDLLQGTTDETECPFDANLLIQHKPGQTSKYSDNGQYFYDMDSSSHMDGNKRRRRDGSGLPEKRKFEFDKDKCWFCLSSPTVEKHLVICVGEHCYLALAKGPLTKFHALILPVAHHQSYTQAPAEIKDEIEKFKLALHRFYKSLQLVPVFFERNFKTSHLQIQAVPIPKNLISGMVDEVENIASADSIEFRRLSPNDDICDLVPPGTPYFHMQLPEGEQLFTKTKANFPLHVGRDILANPSFLDCEEKVDWKECALSKDNEIEQVSEFREKFRPFDFTDLD